ncbi:recombinase family protein [Bacillus sp. UNC322MFChir4.1]|uniref:recombinase family protein n=1 Tax=Bacillus sp. UNC322MFChir4.1 TaxID=1449045 RepID=UPI000A63829E|nr:recombinase family protein [Bacillus sp. UNC322MFChir4.1]
MNYAVYVRVSTDKDEQVSSVENQIDICRYWLEKNGYEWDDSAVYFDDGISGTAWLERHAMQLILEKARKKELDTVVFKSIHRLARDLKDALAIKEILIGHGIRMVTIEENYDSLYEGKNDMKFEMYAMFASQLPKTLSVSVSAALTAKIRRGEHTGIIPFGYDRVDKKLVINEEEAKIVREIFELQEKQIGYKTISKYLNEKGIRTKAGNNWSGTTIKHILTNSLYKGEYIMNQYGYVKVDGRKKRIINPKEKWTIFEDHHPAIIPKEQWDHVNNLGDEKRTRTKVDKKNEFRGIVYCAHCDSAIRAVYSGRYSRGEKKEWVYMKCARYKRYGTCVNHVPIQYHELREVILSMLKDKEKELNIQFSPQNEKKHKEKMQKVKKEIQQLKMKKDKLIELYIEGLIGKEAFVQRDKKFEGEIKEKELQLIKLSDVKAQSNEQKEVKKAFALLQEEQDLHETLKILVKKISLYKDKRMQIKYTFDI